MNSATLDEMAGYVREAVAAHRDRGLADAWHQAGRRLGISARRARAYWHGEVARVGADEIEAARRWYADHCRMEAERLAHRALMLRVAARETREKLDGVKAVLASRDRAGRGVELDC